MPDAAEHYPVLRELATVQRVVEDLIHDRDDLRRALFAATREGVPQHERERLCREAITASQASQRDRAALLNAPRRSPVLEHA